ncbi:MAG: HD domain-containing protein [Lachnospiraceae bacterium]|nr:HD domain-containing protein [Lachnospiraceae bacterium]
MNEEKKFASVSMTPENPHWEQAVARENMLYDRADDIRSPFMRDYTRVLHSLAYRRMKHKTQVFYDGAGNDHICTRIEHVAHVDSVSHSIAATLGLNEELTRAISIAHDLGHAPFGHKGEKVLSGLSETYLGTPFWHEQHGVYLVDRIELLEDPQKRMRNLNLTYAVRDGIISHCGEVDQNGIHPREEMFDLKEFDSVGKYQASTWEGCVVKLSDKIAYLGRDIEDADRLGYFDTTQLLQLRALARRCKEDAVNTTVITHSMIIDICKCSSIENGLCLSEEMNGILNDIKKFNYENIYRNPRLSYYEKYAELVLTSLFDALTPYYDGMDSLRRLAEKNFHGRRFIREFAEFLAGYCALEETAPDWAYRESRNMDCIKTYGRLETREQYLRAVVDFIAGMTDNYAADAFGQLLQC